MKSTVKKLIIIFSIFAFIAAAFHIVIEILVFEDSISKVVTQNGPKKLQEREQFVHRFVETSKSELYALNRSLLFQKYYNKNYNEQLIANKFLVFSLANPSFMQLRYIDKNGQEKIRIDRDSYGSDPYIVSTDKLQDKKDRYYFSDSKTKELGKVWFSALDLNIEHKQVEKPYKPTLRAVLPIDNNKEFGGIIIINFFMDQFLKQLTHAPIYDMIVFNDKGYTLIHYDEEKSWGEYLQEKYSIQKEYPQYADKILNQKNVYTKEFATIKVDSPILDGLNILIKLNSEYRQTQVLHTLKDQAMISITMLVLSLVLIGFVVRVVSKMLIDLDDAHHLVESKTKDIHDEKERYKNLIEDLGDKYFAYRHNLRGKIEYISDNAQNIFEKRDEDLLFKNFKDIASWNDGSLERARPVLKQLIRKKVFHVEYEMNFVKANSPKERTLLFRAHCVFDINNNVIAIEGIAEDISKKIQTEQSFYEHSKMAALGEMIGNIAHQWRQPLSSITVEATGTLYKKEVGLLDDKSFVDSMESINSNAQYLSKTIDTFSNFIKSREDKSMVETTLQEEIELSIMLEKASYDNNYIKIETDICKESIAYTLPQGELTQVIVNILNNAKDVLVEKSDEDDRLVIIKLFKEKDKAFITIEDNGGGIESTILPRIFEPYFTTKHKSQGTGLGLNMSYKIMTESLNGKLEVSNTINGAIFTLQLPL